jgi:hypothetical protein
MAIVGLSTLLHDPDRHKYLDWGFEQVRSLG